MTRNSTRLSSVLGLLFLVNVNNFTDRMILSVLVEPIKKEFSLSDTQIGILTGFAFAIFYAVAGFFIARLADRVNRIKLIAILMVIWSGFAALTGLALNFWHLLVARIGVGVGEAGIVPTCNALIADYSPPEKRPSALAIFTAGGTLGITVGLGFGGWAAEQFGWRWAFVLAALPGLPLAWLVWAFLVEPGRGGEETTALTSIATADSKARDSAYGILRELAGNRLYVHTILGAGFVAFLIFGVINWMPAYVVRRFDLSLANVGVMFGVAIGVGSSIGAVIGGFCANSLAQKDIRWLAWMPAGACIVSFPLYELAIFSDSPNQAYFWIFVVNIVGGSAFGPIVTMVVSVVRPGIRATAASIYGLAASLIGIGSAPLLVGLISDSLVQVHGPTRSLQLALAFVIPVALIGAIHFWRASVRLNVRPVTS